MKRKLHYFRKVPSRLILTAILLFIFSANILAYNLRGDAEFKIPIKTGAEEIPNSSG